MAGKTDSKTERTEKQATAEDMADRNPGEPGAWDVRGTNPGVLNPTAQPVDENGSAPMNRQDDPSPDEEQPQVIEKKKELEELHKRNA